VILGGRVVAMRAIASYGVASLDVLWKCAAVSRQEHKKQQQQTDEHTVSSGTQAFALFWGYACWVWVGWVGWDGSMCLCAPGGGGGEISGSQLWRVTPGPCKLGRYAERDGDAPRARLLLPTAGHDKTAQLRRRETGCACGTGGYRMPTHAR
jgi:hypothetical protein